MLLMATPYSSSYAIRKGSSHPENRKQLEVTLHCVSHQSVLDYVWREDTFGWNEDHFILPGTSDMKEPAMDWMFVSSHRLYVKISSSMLLTTGVGTSGGNCIMCWSVFVSDTNTLTENTGKAYFLFWLCKYATWWCLWKRKSCHHQTRVCGCHLVLGPLKKEIFTFYLRPWFDVSPNQL